MATPDGPSSTGAEAVTAVARHRPHVVLMDVQMPGMDGLTALQEINRSPNPPKVVMLTTFDRDEHIYGALRAKAAGFLLKDTAPRDLIAAVRTTAEGSAVLSPTVTKRVVQRDSAVIDQHQHRGGGDGLRDRRDAEDRVPRHR